MAERPRSRRQRIAGKGRVFADLPGDDQSEPVPVISVGDPVSRKSRLLSRQCQTCNFSPDNRMHLAEGHLRDMVRDGMSRQSFVVCHDTRRYWAHPDAQPAICRGFYTRYSTTALQVIGRLFGFVECDPPIGPPQE
jgi:hypothetical protein